MAIYVVLHDFADAHDGGYVYRESENYPRKGSKPSEARIAELLSATNRTGQALIKEADVDVEPYLVKKAVSRGKKKADE